ncbi:hypothetical protein [Pseudoalteromonas gelatinilytica]|uniref:Uncharacterized protein n=1 Tax=Pseudoalteromonas gelatinilytica TaxID=1703256 RepID=A0ABQ1UC04_9GAMM|nr:hypothetical protein [Pseudoalteromonas profundi]GGF12577.1 hypothetical protein GCM10008027_41740 [Pseudoalteromonas profundi]
MNQLINYSDWYELRELVLYASHYKTLKVPTVKGYDSIVDLVKDYLASGEHSSLDKAATRVATLCPGATEEGISTPWLLLEKS